MKVSQYEFTSPKVGQKILLVDDQTYNLFVLEQLLSTLPNVGIVEKAMHGLEAIAMIKANKAKQFDLIFMDLNMPIMDGFEVRITSEVTLLFI